MYTTKLRLSMFFKFSVLKALFTIILFFDSGTIGPPVTVPNGNIVQSDAEENRSDNEPLPPGWEMRFDTYGRRYYVDHNTR